MKETTKKAARQMRKGATPEERSVAASVVAESRDKTTVREAIKALNNNSEAAVKLFVKALEKDTELRSAFISTLATAYYDEFVKAGYPRTDDLKTIIENGAEGFVASLTTPDFWVLEIIKGVFKP